MIDAQAADRATADFFARFFGDGRSFKYRPQPDITTYELALCMYLLMVQAWNKSLRNEQKVYDQLPTEAQRHFVVVRNDNDS